MPSPCARQVSGKLICDTVGLALDAILVEGVGGEFDLLEAGLPRQFDVLKTNGRSFGSRVELDNAVALRVIADQLAVAEQPQVPHAARKGHLPAIAVEVALLVSNLNCEQIFISMARLPFDLGDSD